MMMVEADEGSPEIMDELFSGEDDYGDVLLDLDFYGKPLILRSDESLFSLDVAEAFPSWHEYEEQFGHGGRSDDLPFVDALKGEQTSSVLSTEDKLPGYGVLSLSHKSESSEYRRECSDGFLESAGSSGVPDSQGNGLIYMVADGGLQNALSSRQNASNEAPFETLNHCEPFNFHSANHVIHNRGSSDLNDTDKAPFERPIYGEPSSFHGANHVIHEQDSLDFRYLNHEENPFDQLSSTEGIGWNPFNSFSLNSCKNYGLQAKDEKEEEIFESRRTLPSFGRAGEIPAKNSAVVGYDWQNPGALPPPLTKVETNSLKMENKMPYSAVARHDWHPNLQIPEIPGILPPPSIKVEINSLKMENEMPNSVVVGHDRHPVLQIPEIPEVQNNTVEQSNADDDPDVCVLEDMSAPARPNRIAMKAKLAATSQHSTSRDPGVQMVTAHSRPKPNDERVIFRVALQDLTQPKSEATLPDGVLSVPLLKHQRIALSWMVNKETRSACCSGGILADDQGLGKTVSTIALILKERSPSSKVSKTNEKQSEAETLNLDDDDEAASEAYNVTEEAEPCRVNGINGVKTYPLAKGRPSGGTLIVCPTSVLRQWSEELHNKVTREAGLSVLVYHGSNRTKDPVELAKYDVVVTTYAIVSMEVPKQPVVNENENQMGSPLKQFSSGRKRKQLESVPDRNSCRSKKSRKGIDNDILENIYGPLAQVGWFRVVLDEAQSIKNHRTQVARACWGLRAKRRWCLSGTPIQNAIDDLYSYFRFLRHEPYAVFRTFCEQLKVPIHRNPRNGYKKLQAVLKTIMLRRTKGTFIDGEPIINLPPKTIELKKVDFSKEERDFYSRLEADSRAQFAEYAAAGTVKQNYVNILLMLLRLRQACDHPLLVKGFNSNSKMTSSIEMAKKLSREKQISLLSCLEASLAICGICSDPPEDAVVTVCGHVFCNQCISEYRKYCQLLGLEVVEVSEPHSLICPQDSSKIKAALDILLSLSGRQDCATKTESSELIEGGYASGKLRVCDSGEDNRTSDMNRDSNNSVKVVSEKAIVFSQWTGMLDLLEACLKNTSIQYRRLDGTMPVAARDRAVKDFNSLPQVSVMIMSLKAASLGLNMVAASNVLLLDLWWNPTTEDQAIDRAHRIGQTRPVSVFRLTVKDTVEDRILALQQRKRRMVASAFGEDETGSRQTRLTVDDLKYLFRVD
ncbi:hypothetical protein DH2020_008950 [Rehmannia glutinosa]|uniref:Helicase-like transcription factor CHR28 n=1 Tax=Rehmannia glutinosa TaxID=99300 RepID=A0ABR0X4V4_REHGL